MGNCINRSPSTDVASQEGGAVVETKLAEVEESIASCDERTVGSSSYAPTASSSPPGSPMLPSVIATGRLRPSQNNDSEPVESTNNISSTKLGSDDSSIMEQQREEGQTRLRELVITGANAGAIDWKSIIALAEDLHRKEQGFLRSYNEHKRAGTNSVGNGCNSTRTNISRRQAFFEKRRRRRDMARRKKLESVGSFSVNVLSYDEDNCEQQKSFVESSSVESDIDAPIIENDASLNSIEVDELEMEMEDEIDVFEDDDPSPLYHEASRYKRPATPAPFIRPTSSNVNVSFGGSFSFMAATSLFNSAEGEEEEESSSCSSTSSSVQNGDHWDLVTIDENSTVADW